MRNMFGRAAKAPEALMAGPATMDMTRPVLPERAATYVDASSEFTGSLKLSKSVHIDGTVDGELDCAATVTIGASGKVTARISAESVLIDGEVHGDIEARTEITLRKTARVYGDLRTEGIVIERGAKVEGQITIGPTASAKGAGPATSMTPTVPTAKPVPVKSP
jgi:cytoskeletal protein CcmA (bactofilin family)